MTCQERLAQRAASRGSASGDYGTPGLDHRAAENGSEIELLLLGLIRHTRQAMTRRKDWRRARRQMLQMPIYHI